MLHGDTRQVRNPLEQAEQPAGQLFGFIGLAMLVCFIIIRALRKKDEASSEPGKSVEPNLD